MTACALCKSDLSTASLVAMRARFGRESRRVACADCGLVQVSPQPSRWELAEHYRSHEYRREHGQVVLTLYGPQGRRDYHPSDPDYPAAVKGMGLTRARWTAQLAGLVAGESVLDVGCGNGYVLDAFADMGCLTFGLEPDEDEAAKAAEHHTVQCCTLETYSHAAYSHVRADLITAYHVLEHLHDPVSSLKLMRGMLTDKGRVVIEVPNVMQPNGPLERNHFQWVHLFDFSEQTLVACMQQAGFEVTLPETQGVVLVAMGRPTERTYPIATGLTGERMAGLLDGYRTWGGGV